ncbi:MAG: hypothetical protein JXR94_23790 [Candidatus Hydrogenedentes bacterium]|nr:hypothetical protein [Candidatus Hydrogenedentota bacterium]
MSRPHGESRVVAGVEAALQNIRTSTGVANAPPDHDIAVTEAGIYVFANRDDCVLIQTKACARPALDLDMDKGELTVLTRIVVPVPWQ